MKSLRTAASFPEQRAAVCLLALIALLFSTHSCIAQAADDLTLSGNPTLTLHVYTNLIQIPVLILGPFLDYAPKVDPKKLTVIVDRGKPFHPVHVRPEGEDPISLAILLDLSDDRNDIFLDLPGGLAKLARQSLRPHDQLAIYAVNCGLTRVSHFAPPDVGALKLAVDAAIATAQRDNKHHRSCGNKVNLLDAMVLTANELAQLPGRRVVLAISHGEDVGSTSTGQYVREVFVDKGVALFGLSPSRSSGFEYGIGSNARSSRHMSAPTQTPDQSLTPTNSFEALCELTGGLVRHASSNSIDADLRLFIKTLRERVIIEFPRPRDASAGSHSIDVKLEKSRAFIRAAGIGVPVADPTVLADPNTIHPENSPPAAAPIAAPPQS